MRRRHLVRVVVVAVLLTGASLAYGLSTGPVASRTGALPIGGLPTEILCTQCHNGFPANDGSGSVQIFDLPTTYKTGDTLRFRVAVSRPTPPEIPNPKWGFQITAVNSARGLGSGTWLPMASPQADSQQIMTPSQASTFKTRRYLEHTFASTRTGQRDGAEWTVNWIAPSTDSGAIYFFAASNAANGDGVSIGSDDHIFTTVDSVLPAGPVGVPPVHGPATFTTMLLAPYPNPMTVCSDMSYEIATAGRVSLTIHDVQGRTVRTLFRGWHAAGPGYAFWDGKRDDGSRARNGVYFVRMSAPGLSKPLTHKVTLAR